jgi:hypothetical protein
MELKEQLREDKNMLNKIKIFGKKLLWTVWIVFLGLLLIPGVLVVKAESLWVLFLLW